MKEYLKPKSMLPILPSLIKGVDEILGGGIPKGRTTLIQGGPGTGKTILGQQIAYNNALGGIPAIYVSFEENGRALRENAKTMGWDFSKLEREGNFCLIDAMVNPQSVKSGSFSLDGMLAALEGKAKEMSTKLLVIDALDMLLRLFSNLEEQRNQVYRLQHWLQEHEFTTVLTSKIFVRDVGTAGTASEFFDFMADCVVNLEQKVQNRIAVRRLRVSKYRGVNASRNEHAFVITSNGIKIIPVSRYGLQHRALGDRVSTGHPRLDAITQGGFRRASCILLSGNSGTGKTTFASLYARGVCERDERILYISFEESPDALMSAMASVDIHLKEHIDRKRLRYLTAMPESMGSEEHLIAALEIIDDIKPDHLVIDAISACMRMSTKKDAFDYIIRLVNACKDRGMTVLLTNQTSGIEKTDEITGHYISSLIDTLITLRYVESGGELNRILMVVKSRGSSHSNQYREYLITSEGVDILDVFVGSDEVLTGAARREREAEEAAKLNRQRLKLRQARLQVEEKKTALKVQESANEVELEALEEELESLQRETKLLEELHEQRTKVKESRAKRARSTSSKRAR